MKRIGGLPTEEREILLRNTAAKFGVSEGIVERTFGSAGRWTICSTPAHGLSI